MVAKSLSQLLHVLFAKYRGLILVTYGLTFLENVFELLYPLVIGLTIDRLLQGSYLGLIALVSIWLLHTVIEVGRNIYDTRAFAQIYSHLATSIVLEQKQQNIPTSQIVARSSLSREFVDFFEQDIPHIMTALFGFIGAWVMLLVYDVQIALYCLLLCVPLSGLNYFYAQKSLGLNHQLNNQLEREVDILGGEHPENVQLHFQRLSRIRIQLSNTAALNWGVMELWIIVLFMAVMIRAVMLFGSQPGEIYAVISYTWNYRQSLDVVPTLVQQLGRLHDIGERMRLH
jgi:ABC-type multidrug transport system fused ATPase/permease subunit